MLTMISKDAQLAGKAKPNIGARLPHDVYAELVRVKDATGKSESQLINEAIAQYLGITSEVTIPDRLSQLEATMETVQTQVGAILGKFQRLATR